MFVSPLISNNDDFKNNKILHEITYEKVNQYNKEIFNEKTDLIDYKRKITIFPFESRICISDYSDPDEQPQPEEYILLENLSVQHNTPLGYDYYFQNIEKSYINSTFLFVRKQMPGEKNENNLFLLYGFSTGYGIQYDKNKLNWLKYGASVLDKVNTFSNSEVNNLTFVFDNEQLFDDNCEFISSIFPNIYSELQYDFITNNRYKKRGNIVPTTYQFKDLLDDKTEVRRVNFNPIYQNAFEPEGDFYTMDSFMNICFLLLMFQVKTIDLIYDTKKGLNIKNIERYINPFIEKTKIDFSRFIIDFNKKIDNLLNYFMKFDMNKNKEYLVMISTTDSTYGIKVISKSSHKELIIKMTKGEMIERIFSNFYISSSIINRLNQTLIKQQIDNEIKRIGYHNIEILDEKKY